jgi:hypothetical protein
LKSLPPDALKPHQVAQLYTARKMVVEGGYEGWWSLFDVLVSIWAARTRGDLRYAPIITGAFQVLPAGNLRESAGRPEPGTCRVSVDLQHESLFSALVDARLRVQAQRKSASATNAKRLKVVEILWKLMANCLFGIFLERFSHSSHMTWREKDTPREVFARDAGGPFYAPWIGAGITATIRCIIYLMERAAQNVYYIDTDGMVVDAGSVDAILKALAPLEKTVARPVLKVEAGDDGTLLRGVDFCVPRIKQKIFFVRNAHQWPVILKASRADMIYHGVLQEDKDVHGFWRSYLVYRFPGLFPDIEAVDQQLLDQPLFLQEVVSKPQRWFFLQEHVPGVRPGDHLYIAVSYDDACTAVLHVDQYSKFIRNAARRARRNGGVLCNEQVVVFNPLTRQYRRERCGYSVSTVGDLLQLMISQQGHPAKYSNEHPAVRIIGIVPVRQSQAAYGIAPNGIEHDQLQAVIAQYQLPLIASTALWDALNREEGKTE